MDGRKICFHKQVKTFSLNSFVQAFPTYVMSCFVLLANIINSLNLMVRQFFGMGLRTIKECARRPGMTYVSLRVWGIRV